MTDKTLVCRDCGEEFVFTIGEQEFYQEKDSLTNQLDVQLVEELKRNKITEDSFCWF